MKLKVCADYSFIAIAFSCQAENCCHPVSENNKLFICTNCISTFTRDARSLDDLDRFIIVRSILARAGRRTHVFVSSCKKNEKNEKKKDKKKMNLLEPSYPKDIGDISSEFLSYYLCLSLSPRLSIRAIFQSRHRDQVRYILVK